MPRLFGINSKQIGIIATLLVIIFLGACYFFIYVPNNEKTVQERRFRSLQNIDNNFHAKISNDTLLINNLLQEYQSADSLEKAIRANKYTDSISAEIIKLPQKLRQQFSSESNDVIKNNDTVDYNENKFALYASKVVAAGKDKYLLRVRARFSIERFVSPLLPPDVFDNYIVFYNNRKIFETFRSGLNGNTDSLLEARNKITVPGVRSIKIGGTDYKIFSQPVTIMGERWIVSGLVTSKNYLRERDQLPLWIVLLLLTAAIGIIVCIPWIKLYHMGNKDKLTVRDGVATILVSMILMSLIFFIVFKYDGSLGIFKKQLHNPSDTLANKVTRAFEGELRQVYHTLDLCDSVFCTTPEGRTGESGTGHDKFHDTILKNYSGQLDIHQVYWLDQKGREVYNWITDINIPKGTNLKMRDYFIAIIKNNHPNWVCGKDQFFLSQNISRASGVFTSVIAKKSRLTTFMAGVGFTVKTLDDVILPDGYQFAIIDANGEVRYHSRPEFNLNQNLKTEFADSSMLVSSLEARSNTNFQTEYFGRRYDIKIKPLSVLPYSIVVFEDLEYNDTRDMESYAFTLSMLLCLLVFLIFETAAVFFVSSKQSFFKKQFLETSWIGPKISSHGQYNMAILVNLFIIGITSVYFASSFTNDPMLIRCSFMEYLYITLFSITLTSLTLNAIFYKSYKLDECYKYRYKKRAIICSALIILAIDVVAYITLDGDGRFFSSHFAYLLYYEIITIGLFWLAMRYLDRLLPQLSRFTKLWLIEWKYTQSFAMMSTLRLVITSGIPVAFLFMYSYDYEQNLDTRYRQYHFAKDMISRQGRAAFDDNAIGIYTDGVSVSGIRSGGSDKQVNAARKRFDYDREDYFAAKLLSAFRFRFNTIEVRNNNMNMPGIANTAFFNKLTWEKSNSKAGAVTYYRTSPAKYIVLHSLNINYRSSNGFLLIPAIILFYIIIHNIIRKLFALNLPVEDGWDQINKGLVTNNELNKLLLIVGSPGSGKLSNLVKMIGHYNLRGNNGERLVYNKNDDEKCNVFIADMIVLPAGPTDCGNDDDDSKWKECLDKALDKKYSLVIINHLEYNMKDGKSNNMKLDLLEKLMSNGKSKIMIISTVHPVSFLDSYNQQIRQANNELDDKSKAANAKPENELERWMVLFGHFRIIIEPLEDKEIISDLPIMKEIQYSHFLSKMESIIPKNIATDTNRIGLQSDSMIFKLQLTSQYFYTYIWQSLTMEEKFLLYDLAEDGLVNSYDDYNLSILISKKLIIVSDGTLMLFNKGFRNFILTAIGQTEADRIKAQVKANGNWDSLKTPLLLTMLAILAFLFTSQQEAYSRIVTYVTAFSAGIPAILKVFSMFGSSPQKSSS